jgi:dCTP deaminase
MSDYTPQLFPELHKDLQSLSFTTGIFPSQKIKNLIEDRKIYADINIEDAQIQPASMDLRLGAKAYRVQASILPGKDSTVEGKIKDLVMATIDLTQPAVFEKECVYIVPLIEQLNLPHDVSAKANPKSTTGRLDIFTRLICDRATEFERVPEGYKGPLYAEISPRTFTIILSKGARLNQLRFMRGRPRPSDTKIEELDIEENLVYATSIDDQTEAEAEALEANIRNGLRISVNLKGDRNSNVIGYRAKKSPPAIDLMKIGHYDPEDFWDVIRSPKSQNLILHPNDFYILFSEQKVRIPNHYAAELVPYDPSIGEFRIHYAGFFDPGFGYGAIKGTNAVLEVRSHDVPFLVEHDQTVGRLIYERLLAVPDKVYGADIGSSYQGQGLALSKQFRRFRQHLENPSL